MRESIQRGKKWMHRTFEKCPRVSTIMTVVLILLLTSAGVVAQSQITESDDFEDGDVDGWQSPQGETPVIDSTSANGDYSLLARSEQLSEQSQPAMVWQEGPTLDMSEDFTVEMYIQPDHRGDSFTIRAGIAGENQSGEGENAFIVFNNPSGETYLSTYATQTSPGPEQTVSNSFEQQWVYVKLTSEQGSGTLNATISPVGSSTQYNLTADGFAGVKGQFAVNPGYSDSDPRSIYLDSVTVSGTEVPQSEELSVDTRDLYAPGTTHDYRILFETFDSSVGHNTSDDVTENATVTSGNTSVLTVNSNNTMTAVNDENVSAVVNVTAEYSTGGETYTTTEQVVVAEATMENLEILPTGLWRVSAVMLDHTIFLLLIAAFFSVAAARFAGAFAGLATAEMIIVIGWLAGYVGIGIAMVSVFMCMFIGLNLAANIDYTVSR